MVVLKYWAIAVGPEQITWQNYVASSCDQVIMKLPSLNNISLNIPKL